MKLLHSIFLICLVVLLSVLGAFGQAYPTTSPTYIPNAVGPATTYASSTADYVLTAQNLGTVEITITGSPVGLVSAPQISNDGTNYTTVFAIPCGGGAPLTSITAAGCYRFSAAGSTNARLHITVHTSGSIVVKGTGTLAPTFNYVAGATVDPCRDPLITKSVAVINVGAATTTKIVDTSASTTTYVCGFTATLAGTTPTVVFKTGTNVSTDCDTTPASLTGIFAPVTGSVLAARGDITLFKSIAGGQICATTVGTGSSLQGFLNYVQQ